jgi:hypothetical protein
MALESSVKKSAAMRDRTAAAKQEYRTLLHGLERRSPLDHTTKNVMVRDYERLINVQVMSYIIKRCDPIASGTQDPDQGAQLECTLGPRHGVKGVVAVR